MTTGHSPSSGDYDATTALSRFASPQDLERIAATRPDLHSILATNPSIPPQVRAMLERSDDAVVQEVLARQAGRAASQTAGPTPPAQAAQPSQPAQPQAPGQIDAMAPTMAVGTAAGTVEAQPQQGAAAGSGYGQVPQGYGSVQPTAPGAAPQQGAPQGYGRTTPQPPQSPLPQDPSQVAQPVALPPSTQPYSAPSMQSAAQPVDQQTAMPPGVPSGPPSGYAHGQSGAPSGYGPGQAQAYDPGQAYGPSQSGMPAYGAEMYAQQPQPRKRRGLKVLAIILPVALLLTGGGVAAWYFLWRNNVYATSQLVVPSESWADGTEKAWSADVAANAQPYVVGSHFLTFDRTEGTLTGYSPLGGNMKEAWQTTLDDEDLTSSYGTAPAFQAWGNDTLVYKSTLVDLKSGNTSSAPWGDEKSAMIAGDIAISCKASNKCTAWDVNQKQKWSREIPGAGEASNSTVSRNESILVRNNKRYVRLYNIVINIDNGETLILGGGSKANTDLNIIYFKDSWGTFEEEKDKDSDSDSDSSPTTRYKVTVYDLKGRKQSSFSETLTEGERPVLGDNELITAEQYRTYFKDNDYSKADVTATTDEDGCITKLSPKKGKSITVPQPDGSSGSSSDSDSPQCPSGVSISQNGSVTKLATWKRGDFNEIQMLMNVKTGKEIRFNGIDWKNGDSLIVAKPDLIIGYNKDEGKVSGFKPAS